MINIKKLFNKSERGLRKEKVKVTRDGKTFYREQMVGRKEEEKPKLQLKREKEIADLETKIQTIYAERKILDIKAKDAQKESNKLEYPSKATDPGFKEKNDAEMIVSRLQAASEEKTLESMRIGGKIDAIKVKEKKRKDKIEADKKS